MFSEHKMGTIAETNPKEFWNRRSKSFPRYTPGEDQFEAGVLRLIREEGLSYEGRSVLDVGCGCGMYTIRLAQEAARVTALDISDEMLSILKKDAETEGLSNLEYVNSNWLEFSTRERYDLVFCSMTPALRSEEGKLKVLRHARDWVVFIGSADLICSNVMAGLYEYYGLTPNIVNNGPEMRNWLGGRGVKYSYRPIRGEWVKLWSKPELAERCIISLKNYGIDPDPVLLGDYLEKYKVNDSHYQEKTPYDLELIIWRNS